LVIPPIDVKMGTVSDQGKNIIRITVPEGKDVPYVLEGSKIYLRQGAKSELAARDDIVELVRRAPREKKPSVAKESDKQTQRSSEAKAPSRGEAKVGKEVKVSGAGVEIKPPGAGVEIVESVKRDGVFHHTMCDLRDGNKVQNVTRSSARRLWRYAIALKEKGLFKQDKVTWKGDLGLWHKYKKAGRDHYDLAQRTPTGEIRVYYGVNEDGIDGPWKAVVAMKG